MTVIQDRDPGDEDVRQARREDFRIELKRICEDVDYFVSKYVRVNGAVPQPLNGVALHFPDEVVDEASMESIGLDPNNTEHVKYCEQLFKECAPMTFDTNTNFDFKEAAKEAASSPTGVRKLFAWGKRT